MLKVLEKIKKMFLNLEKKIEENLSKINFSKEIFLAFIIIFILLLFQCGVVSLYFDDYGNGSLSYAYFTPNVEGTNFTFAQLFEWMQEIYEGWGGRVLYAVFIIMLIKDGITAYMVCQAFVITLILYFIYKIVYLLTNKKCLIVPIVLLALYMLIDMEYLRHGIYWASASVLYIWPLLPLFALMYFYMSICKKIKNNEKTKLYFYIPILVILTFLSTFSQEQVGVAVIVFLISFVIFNHVKEIKKYLIVDVPLVLTSLISYLVLFLAPGNWVRMDTNAEFSNLSFIEKISKNFPEILRNIFSESMDRYMYILTFILFIMIAILIYKNVKINKKYFIFLIIPVLLIGLTVIIKALNLSYTSFCFITFGIVWFISFLIVSIFYFNYKKNIETCSILFSAAASIFCLLLSPTNGGRTGLPFIFMIFIIIALFINEIYKSKSYIIKFLIMLFVCILLYKGTLIYIEVYNGYKENYSINKLNYDLLKSYDMQEKIIKLYKVKNVWYGSTMPYEEDSMNFWIKEYFNIPQDVEFEWIDIYEKLR